MNAGLDLAVEQVLGAEPAWFIEYDAAPSKILAHHYPNVLNYGDVTTVDWTTVPPIDILTGGYPCQPFSAAGQRKGTDDERHLWPYVREAIRVLRPRFTMGLPAGWVTDVPDLSRAEQLKAIGNGVCPPQAVAAIRELLELRQLTIQQEAA